MEYETLRYIQPKDEHFNVSEDKRSSGEYVWQHRQTKLFTVTEREMLQIELLLLTSPIDCTTICSYN